MVLPRKDDHPHRHPAELEGVVELVSLGNWNTLVGLAGELQQLGKLRDGGGTLRLERDENRAATIGQLVYGDDGEPS